MREGPIGVRTTAVPAVRRLPERGGDAGHAVGSRTGEYARDADAGCCGPRIYRCSCKHAAGHSRARRGSARTRTLAGANTRGYWCCEDGDRGEDGGGADQFRGANGERSVGGQGGGVRAL